MTKNSARKLTVWSPAVNQMREVYFFIAAKKVKLYLQNLRITALLLDIACENGKARNKPKKSQKLRIGEN